MDKKNIIIAILILIIIVGAAYIFFTQTYDTAYQKAYAQGVSDGVLQLIQKINSDGLIPVISNNSVQYVPIQNLCGGKA